MLMTFGRLTLLKIKLEYDFHLSKFYFDDFRVFEMELFPEMA